MAFVISLAATATVVATGCGDSGSAPMDGGGDGGGTCTGAADCDDGLFCNGAEQCDPSAAGANDRGCLAGASPCVAGQSCDEEVDECSTDCASGADADGDGHDAVECGGDDCDDSDPARYPGNTEVCDAEGVDEDCDPATLGGPADRDVDGDGTVSADCCNIQPDGTLLCGEDCDDDAEGINPGTPESCNMVDDDCDGSVDEGVGTSCWADADGDGLAPADATAMSSCTCGAGLTDADPADSSDCNDDDADIGACPLGLCSEGACHPLHSWSDGFGGTDFDRGAAVTIDKFGNIFVTGSFQGTINFGSDPADELDAGDGQAIFVASFNDAGTHRWSVAFGGGGGASEDDGGTAIAASGSGVYVAGRFDGSVDFGGGYTASAASGEDRGFLALLSADDGSASWAVDFGSGGFGDSLVPADIAVGASSLRVGPIAWVTGSFEGSVDFGGGTLTSAGGADIFVAGFSAVDSGGHIASVRFGASGFANEGGNAIATDESDHVYVAGRIGGDVDFGGGTHTAEGFGDMFLVELDDTLSHVWSKDFGGSGSLDIGSGVAVDADGNVYLAGQFEETVDFGGGATTSAGLSDGFVASFDGSGTHRWSTTFGAADADAATSVEVHGGDVVVTGAFQGSVDFGGGSIMASEGRDAALFSYDTTGGYRWSRGFGDGGASFDSDIALDLAIDDTTGAIAATGSFEDAIDFGDGSISSSGELDVFVVRFLP